MCIFTDHISICLFIPYYVLVLYIYRRSKRQLTQPTSCAKGLSCIFLLLPLLQKKIARQILISRPESSSLRSLKNCRLLIQKISSSKYHGCLLHECLTSQGYVTFKVFMAALAKTNYLFLDVTPYYLVEIRILSLLILHILLLLLMFVCPCIVSIIRN